MGMIATVLQWLSSTVNGEQVRECLVDPGTGANATAQVLLPPGLDAQGLPGDYVACIEIGGGRAAVAWHDPQIQPIASGGELAFFSRSAPGVRAALIHLKANGSIMLNGVEITALGEIKAPLEVSAMNATVPVKLSTHLHPTGMGPSGPPTPGS